MVAPRATARSQSSRSSAAAPSVMTKPSRRASNGREWPEVERAVMLVKAAMATGCMLASAPPPTATSHRPEATRRAAAPMAWDPAAQAVTMTSDGPCQPWRMEIPAAPALAIIMGTSRGETRRAPFSLYTITCSARVSKPPTPVAKMTPALAGSASISPASSTAMSAAAMLNWAKRSSLARLPWSRTTARVRSRGPHRRGPTG